MRGSGLTTQRVAIYARVSTAEQSADCQLRDLRQYVAARGMEATEYVDSGFSGATQNRPAKPFLGKPLVARPKLHACVTNG